MAEKPIKKVPRREFWTKVICLVLAGLMVVGAGTYILYAIFS